MVKVLVVPGLQGKRCTFWEIIMSRKYLFYFQFYRGLRLGIREVFGSWNQWVKSCLEGPYQNKKSEEKGSTSSFQKWTYVKNGGQNLLMCFSLKFYLLRMFVINLHVIFITSINSTFQFYETPQFQLTQHFLQRLRVSPECNIRRLQKLLYNPDRLIW